ncbi:MAG TPA: ATP-binding protein, partial [Pyrinomonadaceae bacterium]|nr:ATP-binding protein [Pyrinomonadaceae bacterium]
SPTPPPNLHQWGAVTLFHGLPSDRVHAIAQTEFGVTWFATDGGLASYNGRRTHAVIAEGLPAGRVLTMRVDYAGALWVGTENGAARLANGKFAAIPETAGKVITAIITPQRDRAILSSENGQIFDCQITQPSERLEPGEGIPGLTFSVKVIPAEPLQSADKDQPGLLKITSLAMVGEKLYAGTQSRGLILVENGEAKEVLSKPRSFFINALETDSQGQLWAGARARAEAPGLLNLRDPIKPVRSKESTGSVTAIARGANGDIWVASDGRGAFHFQDGKLIEHFTFEGTGGALRSDHVFGVFVDNEEVVWFATDKGVCRYDPHSMRTENISNNAGSNYVRALVRTKSGQLLAGTNSGLYTYDDSTDSWIGVAEVGPRIIYAVGEDKNGRVLVATANGLFAAPSNNAFFTRIPPPNERPQGDSVRAVTTSNDVTYIATYGYGVERIQGSQRTLVWPESSADNRLREITALGSDSANRLLIGTASAGGFLFDGKVTSTEPALDRLKGGAVWTIATDGPGTWLGTDNGLYLFQGGELRDIVSGVNARSVVVPKDTPIRQVWCATVGRGLMKIVLDDQFGPIVSRLDIEQGLPSQRVFAVMSERSEKGTEQVIAGTSRGLVRYEPGYISPTVLPARIISQRIHQPEELRSGLKLEYPQNSLLLDVTAISSRTFPEQFQYAFLLSDSAGKVIRQKLSPDSQFPMEKLEPGTYQVVARAFTKDLMPTPPLQFNFTVERAPFPWTSTALAVLLLLALLALLWAILERRRIVRTSMALVEANQELADARLNLANEAERERGRIARDLHDQTLADLRHLLLMADQFSQNQMPNGKKPAAADLRGEIESISREVRRICEDLSPSVLQNVGFAAALEFALSHAVQQAAPEKRLAHEFICDDALEEETQLPPNVQMQIYRITQEALNNICRHANATQVRMVVNASPTGDFELTIDDDGNEFDPATGNSQEGRGLANMRARASLIEAEISWNNREGGGTVFKLRRAKDVKTTREQYSRVT